MEIYRRAEPESTTAKGLGFVVVRGLLWWMLVVFVFLIGIAVLLSWHFEMDLSVQARGQIRPMVYYQVKSAISGIVSAVGVREGTWVKTGQTLALLDDAEWRLELEKLERDMGINRIQVEEVEAEYREARKLCLLEEELARVGLRQAILRQEQVRAEQQLVSLAILSEYGWSRKPLAELWPVQQAAAAVRNRRAEWAAAVGRLQLADGQLRARKSLDQVYAGLLDDRVHLEQQLAKTVLRAPGDGRVLTHKIEKRVGDRIGSGEVLLEIAADGGWLAEIIVAEQDLSKVAVGQDVRLYIEAYPHMEHKVFNGKVGAVGMKRVVAGGYQVAVRLEDSALATGQYLLVPGMEVEVRIVVERGRIAEVAWARLMRNLGKVYKKDLYLVDDK